MSYYNKEGNTITIKARTLPGMIIRLSFGLFFGISFGFLSLVTMYISLFVFKDDNLESTLEKVSIVEQFLIFCISIPFSYVAILCLRGYITTYKSIVLYKIIVLEIKEKLIRCTDSYKKYTYRFEDFEKARYNMIIATKGGRTLSNTPVSKCYHSQSSIEGKNIIIYFSDRDSDFDLLDAQYISSYVGVPISQNTTEMDHVEYNEFRKKELEDRKSETREMYFL